MLLVAKLGLRGPEWTLRDASVVDYKMFGGRVVAQKKSALCVVAGMIQWGCT